MQFRHLLRILRLLLAPVLLSAGALILSACAADTGGSVNGQSGSDRISGEVRFAREVELPAGAVVTVILLDTSLIDAPSRELGRDVLEAAERLPARFRIAYDASQIEEGNEYTLYAKVELGETLLYSNDTVHPVLTRGAPRNSDVRVVSTNPFDRCVEPLAVELHAEDPTLKLPAGAELRVRLVDVTEPGQREVLTETTLRDPGAFPIEVELPPEGVAVSRHRGYELEAEIWVNGELLLHIPNVEWRRTVLPHCPDRGNPIVNSLFAPTE